MSIQVKCNGCDETIDPVSKPWFEAAYFDPREGDEEGGILDEDNREAIETEKVYHFCSPDCVSVWGMRLSMEKHTGPVL